MDSKLIAKVSCRYEAKSIQGNDEEVQVASHGGAQGMEWLSLAFVAS